MIKLVSDNIDYRTAPASRVSESWVYGSIAGRVSKRCDRATARSRKTFQRLRKIWVFERKNAQFTTVLPFLGYFLNFFVGFWSILFAQNF